MKNSIILGFILAIGTCATAIESKAQNNELINYKENVYARRLSANGEWVASQAGDAQVYSLQTGQVYQYTGFLGLGNCIANNGMAVGEINDAALVMNKDSQTAPQSLRKYWFCDINAITPEATRLTGIINNPIAGETMYVPFYCDIDEAGNVGEAVVLPFPEIDFFGAAPQYVSAVWISDDGHTITGEVLDWRGMYGYPIYFKEDENGEWTYSCPTESLFNTTGIEMQQNPWLSEPYFPEPTDFMSPESREIFEQQQENALMGLGEFPDPTWYMDDQEFEAYVNAIQSYNDWYYSQEDAIKAYIDFYEEVLACSEEFSQNDSALAPSGDYFITKSSYVDPTNPLIFKSRFLKISTLDGAVEEILLNHSNAYPYQILNDGTVIATTPIRELPTSYILLPDADKFIPMVDYFEQKAPEVADWMKDYIPYGTGVVSFSADQTIIAGGLGPDQLAYYPENPTFYYSSYFINMNGESGVESIEGLNSENLYKVFNLQGHLVVETKDKSEIRFLPKGIYIVNGQKIAI